MANDKKVIGDPNDPIVARFDVGDVVEVAVVVNDIIAQNAPQGVRGIILATSYEDDDAIYHMPVVQFPECAKMYNPSFLIIVEKYDGSPPPKEEQEALAKFRERLREEVTNTDDDDD